MMPATFSHRLSRPSRQALHTPQVSPPYITTGSPALTPETSGPTAAIYTGQVVPLTGLPLGSQVRVLGCSVAWNQVAGTCGSGQRTILAATDLSTNPAFTYQATTPAGSAQYLQVAVGGFLATASVNVLVTSALLPAGGTDRTGG